MDNQINEYDENYINEVTMENFKKNLKEMEIEIFMIVDDAHTKRHNKTALDIAKNQLENKISWLEYFVTLDDEVDALMKKTLDSAKTGLAAVEKIIEVYHNEKTEEQEK